MSKQCIYRVFVLLLNINIVFSSFHGDLKGNHNLKHKYYDDRRIVVLTAIRRNILYNSLLNVPDHTRRDVATAESQLKCEGNGFLIDIMTSTLFDMNPDTSEDISVKYIFYSRKKRIPTLFSTLQEYTQKNIPPEFDDKKETVLIIHGYQSYANASWVIDMTDAFLEWADLNVIVVDWSKGCSSWKYWRAVANVKTVGEELIQFLKLLIASAGLQPKKLHLIGHSIGAHILSYAAREIKGIKRITGLDPAFLCVSTSNVHAKLSKSDADFVDVIHTNAGHLLHMHLGLPEPMGHADFYANGGSLQPGCANATSVVSQSSCSHGRAYTYFIETLRHPDCVFLAQPWKDPWNIPDKSLQGRSRPYALMGLPANILKARGIYYVEIKEKAPWCKFVDEIELSEKARLITLIRNLFPGL